MTNKILYDGFHKITEVISEIKGKSVKREKLGLPSAVAGLVTDQDLRVLLVKQFRPTVNQMTYEIPAGILDKDLTPLETLFEELEEECELYKNKDFLRFNLEPFSKYFMVTGSSDAEISLFHIDVMNQDYTTKEIIDDNDVESIVWVTLDELEELVQDNKIVDPKTLIAYHYAKSLPKYLYADVADID